MRNGNDPGPAPQTHGRLQTDDAIGLGRADNGAVGFGANGKGRQTGRRSHPRTGTRPTGVAAFTVRVVHLSAQSAPAAGGKRTVEIGPFAHVVLAENDCPCFAQPFDDKGIFRRDRTLQHHRTGRGRHVGGVDIVLEQHGNAMQRPARAALGQFAIIALAYRVPRSGIKPRPGSGRCSWKTRTWKPHPNPASRNRLPLSFVEAGTNGWRRIINPVAATRST